MANENERMKSGGKIEIKSVEPPARPPQRAEPQTKSGGKVEIRNVPPPQDRAEAGQDSRGANNPDAPTGTGDNA